ncbi:ABC transporter permease [Actinophytocola sp.]|uniref:ABC transporter permease n=1 Tax=Actinophytocola sp. TaxID=1872138 RepID=UPI002D80721B|nr:ABC transporter permease [Actinophytocola sp.]HET9142896.1 ABC transporter permease [Actinophytocola sp.]
MSTLTVHTGHLTMRGLRAMGRQPAFVLIILIQPMIWLLLFGQLFRRVVEIPGFAAEHYIDFLTPGVVVMTVLFSAGWAGMAFIEDMDRGVMDRMLSSPVSRGAMMASSTAYQGVTIVIQSTVIVLVGLLAGARFAGGPLGVLVMLVAAILLGAAFASLSNGMALLVRTRESLIGFSTMLTLPLSFLSSAMLAKPVMPDWMQTVAAYNPVDWTVVAAREALSATPDWPAVLVRLAGLLAVAIVMGWLATRAFRSYQRSL